MTLGSGIAQSTESSSAKWIIGIVGGVASGKSIATNTFERLGAEVIYADRIAHEVLRQPDVVQQVVSVFGETVRVVGAAEELDRKKIAALTFGDDPAYDNRRKALESIVQPRIREALQERIDAWKQSPVGSALVLDIPLLLERGWSRQCDRILMINTPIEKRRLFAAGRGWSEAEHTARESAQWTMQQKWQAATDRIDNDSDQEQLESRVEKWFGALRSSQTPSSA